LLGVFWFTSDHAGTAAEFLAAVPLLRRIDVDWFCSSNDCEQVYMGRSPTTLFPAHLGAVCGGATRAAPLAALSRFCFSSGVYFWDMTQRSDMDSLSYA
jgi:hypothetical protein